MFVIRRSGGNRVDDGGMGDETEVYSGRKEQSTSGPPESVSYAVFPGISGSCFQPFYLRTVVGLGAFFGHQFENRLLPAIVNLDAA